MFMGTPHAGASKATWMNMLMGFARVFKQPAVPNLTATLDPASEVLANLQQDFHAMLKQREKASNTIELLFCMEELPYTGIGKVCGFGCICLYLDSKTTRLMNS